MLSASAGIGSQKNICHKTQTAGQAYMACPAAFSVWILKNVFFVWYKISIAPEGPVKNYAQIYMQAPAE